MFDLKDEQKIKPHFVQQDLDKFQGHMEVFISIDWGVQTFLS